MTSKLAKQLFNRLFDLIFPRYCVLCEKIGAWLCAECQEQKLDFQLAEIKLATSEAVDRIFYIADFDSPLVAKIVKTCKYQGVRELARFMGQKIAQEFGPELTQAGVAILPVPLHQARLRSRGFNQAELIASEIVHGVEGMQIVNPIKRKQGGRAQAKLSRAERLVNLEEAFCLAEAGSELDYGLAIVVDDVVTTGATMNEIAKILKKAGVKEVWGLAFAHGS